MKDETEIDPRKLIDIDALTDQVYKMKLKLSEQLSPEDAEMTDNYFQEVMKGIQPAAEKINKILENEAATKQLGLSFKKAIEDEGWLEKLSKTSCNHLMVLACPPLSHK